jgi:pyridoxine 5-phosphate synthase
MAILSVNVDHVATVRQARLAPEPDPVIAAAMAEMAGARGIIVHLREDRRHIQDRDVYILRQTVKTRLNLEMAATEEIIKIALDVRPDIVTLVPEKREELTTEGGLNVAGQKTLMNETVQRMQEGGIRVSLFIDPDPEQIQASKDSGCEMIEIHTGTYANAKTPAEQDAEFERVKQAARTATEMGLEVHAGHGLDYYNVSRLVALPEIEGYSIGHNIIARAVLVGMDAAVKEMLALVQK